MEELLTFDDVLIKPQFSELTSRKEVDIGVSIGNVKLRIPILSANMDTVTGKAMAIAMGANGGLGVLHRFWSIEENVKAYHEAQDQYVEVAVSIGLGSSERDRATELYNHGARILVLDVAHGAQKSVVDQYRWLKENLLDSFVIVGNFATAESCVDFWTALNMTGTFISVDAFKVGIGPGSACTTRIKTGVGIPQLSAILDIAKKFGKYQNRPLLIADGGMKTSGDIAKALAAGADCVMLGGMLAGTDETPPVVNFSPPMDYDKITALEEFGVQYRGSASKESYEDQGKDTAYITAEGEAFTVPHKGSVTQVLSEIAGGLRSAFTYVGARNIKEFHQQAVLVKVSSNTRTENKAHGK